MDALFGLPRKKEAGKSYRDPLYKQTYFVEQIDIDKYVEDMNADSMPSVSLSSLLLPLKCI